MELAPGAELDETQVATAYGLSRTPLREVFQVLGGEGYLRLEHNRGARVAATSAFCSIRSDGTRIGIRHWHWSGKIISNSHSWWLLCAFSDRSALQHPL